MSAEEGKVEAFFEVKSREDFLQLDTQEFGVWVKTLKAQGLSNDSIEEILKHDLDGSIALAVRDYDYIQMLKDEQQYSVLLKALDQYRTTEEIEDRKNAESKRGRTCGGQCGESSFVMTSITLGLLTATAGLLAVLGARKS
mmetsp:Transcript_15786/g.23778  ORF Transcript_15786/g.23778 Transcript_15786/m.23778 type:complete len:141 (-) Transcript_15786:94-516(-)